MNSWNNGKSEFIDTSGRHETIGQLAERYKTGWRQFEIVANLAEQLLLCLLSGFEPKSPQAAGSLYYLRKITRHGQSLLKICPAPIGEVIVFDRDSAAVLARVIYENYLALFYACIETVDADEWEARNSLLGLRDLVSREELWTKTQDQSVSPELLQRIEAARHELRENAYFKTLSPRRQADFLKGSKSMLLTMEEIDQRLGNQDQRPHGIFKLFSASVHTTPGAFRTMERPDPQETEQALDLQLSTLALQSAGYYLNRATIDVKDLLPEWSSYLPKAYETYQKIKATELQNERLRRDLNP